jgi:hypothetical protein
MRSTWISAVSLALFCSGGCLAQQWELGALAGYAWDHDASIENPTGSAEAGFKPGFAGGVVFGENMYEHLGGEIRYLFRVGGPQLTFGGTRISASGYTNIIHYDFLVHITRKEDKIRPYVAGGAGIKVFTGPSRLLYTQPLQDFALIARGNQAKPLISVGGGVKYRVRKGLQLRLDFRAYMAPAPDLVFRTVFPSQIHGWTYDFMPTLGVSYLF